MSTYNSSRSSRLSRRALHESKKKLLLSLTGIIIVLFLLFKFGIPLLIKFSLWISNNSGEETATSTSQPKYIASPVLNPYAVATNSAQISISGSALPKQQVILFVNGDKKDVTNAHDDGSFSFGNVSLQVGKNTIQTKAEEKNTMSDYSNELDITYSNKAPSLDVNAPSDGQAFAHDSGLNVSGKTDPNATVTVNDFQAIVDDTGNFSYHMNMQNGDNQLKIVATDAAGNKTEKDIKVTFSQ